MKKTLLVAALAAVLLFAFVASAFAYNTATFNGDPNENPIGTNTHFDEPVSGVSPHGGFTLQTDKCKQCHATHGANGKRHLTRNNVESADCAYCHSAESAGAGANVYTGNTMNGHTPGWLKNGKYSTWDTRAGTVGAVNAGAIAQTMIPDGANNLGTHGGYAALYKSGDYYFECNGCHQQHGAKLVPFAFKTLNTAAGLPVFYDSSTKILRAQPRAGLGLAAAYNNPPAYGVAATIQNVDGQNQRVATAVGETTGTAGRAYNMNLWCATCHQNNVLGIEGEDTPGHTWGTHPTYALTTAGVTAGVGNAIDGSVPACYNCHKEDVDFPHSGDTNSYALLKANILPAANDGTIANTVNAAKLDGVCLDCHDGAKGSNLQYSGGDNAGMATNGIGAPYK